MTQAKQKEEKKEMVSLVELPEGTTASLEGKTIVIKGKKGESKRTITNPNLTIDIKDNQIKISSVKSTKREKKTVNTYTAHIKNLIKGANEGHVYMLKVCSSHFPMNVSVNKNQIIIKNFIGEKYPRTLNIKEGVDVKVDGDKITVESNDKELAGTVSSDIERLTKRPGFDTRIFQDGIFITQKDGKEIK